MTRHGHARAGLAIGDVATQLGVDSPDSLEATARHRARLRFPCPPDGTPRRWREIERELAQHVGAVARVLVRRAARGLTSLAAVRQAVAGSIVDFEARERFLAKAGAPRTDTAVIGRRHQVPGHSGMRRSAERRADARG